MNAWVEYVNDTIYSNKYHAPRIVTIDKTNIYFEMTSPTTLARQREHTVSIKSIGSNCRCTVLLGVTMDCQKLPPLIIIKGKMGGWIIHEFGVAANGYILNTNIIQHRNQHGLIVM